MLSRKVNEELKLYSGGELIATVQIVRVAGNVVRLGITALPEIDIRRAELDDEEHGSPVG